MVWSVFRWNIRLVRNSQYYCMPMTICWLLAQLQNLKLHGYFFSASTGLRVNYEKSLWCLSTHSSWYGQYGCSWFWMSDWEFVIQLPWPTSGTTRPIIEDSLPTVKGTNGRLPGINSLLSYGLRVVVIKSIVSCISIFSMCALKIPLAILDHVKKCERVFLWYGNEIDKLGKCLIKW
jgi:hypothetical protein